MAVCTTPKVPVGKVLTVGYAIGCGGDDHTTLTYLPIGKVNTKQLTTNPEFASIVNDDSGSTTDEILVRTGMDLAVGAFVVDQDSVAAAQNALVNYYFTEALAGRQPTVWIKLSGDGYPRVWHLFCNYKAGDESANTDDPMAGNFNFSVTSTGVTDKPAIVLTAAP